MEECSICYIQVNNQTGITSLSCGHKFHLNCIATWYLKKNKGCPLCRAIPTEYENIMNGVTPDETFDESDSDSSSESIDQISMSELMLAITEGNNEHATELIISKCDLEISDTNNNTALIYAIKHNNIPIIKLLISAGANINVEGYMSRTPLIYTMLNNFAATILLLKAGANCNLVDDYGYTALEYLIQEDINEEYTHLMYPILKRGVRHLDRCVYATCDNDQSKYIAILLEAGIDPNYSNSIFGTYLMHAVRNHAIKCVRKLLAKGARGIKYDRFGQNAFMVCEDNDIMKLLLSSYKKSIRGSIVPLC